MDSCGIDDPTFSGSGIFVLVNMAGDPLQSDNKTFGLRGRTFITTEEARAIQASLPHVHTRLLFKSQVKKFKTCGCLR